MADAEIPRKLRDLRQDLMEGDVFGCGLLDEAAALIDRLTRPMTLDECCKILNANEYAFCFAWEVQGPWRVEDPYVQCSLAEDAYNDESMVKLNLFEATAIARAFLAKEKANA
jgi:hypothetical protein